MQSLIHQGKFPDWKKDYRGDPMELQYGPRLVWGFSIFISSNPGDAFLRDLKTLYNSLVVTGSSTKEFTKDLFR